MNVSICCIIKDEHDYLDEWIQHNISIGFDDIYLFEDYDSIPHDHICSKYKNVHLINIKDIIPEVIYKGRQLLLFKTFIDHFYTKTDWTAFIDVDEYIILDNFTDIHDLIDNFKDDYGIYLYWKMFYANGRIQKPDPSLSIFDAYPVSSECFKHDRKRNYKSIVNLKKCYADKITFKNIHEINNGVNTMHIQTSIIRCYHKAYINHYFTKSWEDWIHKIIKRGDVYPGNRQIDDFFVCNSDMLHLKDELINKLNESHKT